MGSCFSMSAFSSKVEVDEVYEGRRVTSGICSGTFSRSCTTRYTGGGVVGVGMLSGAGAAGECGLGTRGAEEGSPVAKTDV